MRSRAFALTGFALLVVASQLLWLSFAAITTQSARDMGVSEGAIGDLAVINPATFVVLAIWAGRWMDRRYTHALAAGALFTAGGALIRVVDPSSYAVVLVGQVVMSVGQPLVLNASTKIASRYFPPAQQTTAIAIASAAQFVGILLAVLTSGSLYDAGGLQLLLGVHAGFAVLAGLATLVSLRTPARHVVEDGDPSLGWLRHDPFVWRLGALLFVGFGSYNAIATWLDTIMVGFGHRDVAGAMIAATTVAGVVGAAVLPGVVAKRDVRRTHCVLTTLVLAAVMLLLTVANGVGVATAALVLLGFLLLGTLPVVLDWSELHVGAARAGTATGFLLLAGNLGAVFVVLTVQVVVHHPTAALVVMAAWAVPGLVFALMLPRHAGTHGDELSPAA
ncbi:MFS transporter [Nocardioides mangrovicus]|uniref:MFS transporter n=1 Tax=Nocardioides mangrovicus TaxID=2478913 RepID=A0A3L8P108_9ACTN|nr:MFS transporter [Nocardioides mangrovicus]RLV48483.1 MFS transporter [Nocardioides mangrovicus]